MFEHIGSEVTVKETGENNEVKVQKIKMADKKENNPVENRLSGFNGFFRTDAEKKWMKDLSCY